MPIRPENRILGEQARAARQAPYGIRDCMSCGKSFAPYRRASRCCGKNCRRRAATARARENKRCAHCGATFRPVASAKAAYCSTSCKSAAGTAALHRDPVRRQRVQAYARRYSKTERYRFNQANAKALRRLREREGGVSFEEWQEICRRHDGRCAYCRKRRRLTMDHVQAISRGGPHIAANIVPACRPCNSSKGNREVFLCR